jgi:triacylglycerol lipase
MPMMNFSTSDAVTWGEFVEVAYQMYLDNPGNPNPPKPSYFPAGWSVAFNLTVDPVLGIFSDVEFIGFIAVTTTTPPSYAIVLRGTESDLDWITDFEFWMDSFTEVPNGGMVEHGFLEITRSLKAVDPATGASQPIATVTAGLTAGAAVTLAGHSLGGAIAVLQAAILSSQGVTAKPQIYTFAAPMAGDRQFSSTFLGLVSESYRIYNKPDIVPDTPGTLLGYTQVQTGIGINSLDYPEIQWSIACFHSLLTYLYILGSTKYGLEDCATSSRQALLVPSAASARVGGIASGR